ncbi:MAG: LytTR family transcriptional regulator, partial [Bacteroidetes bacterium]
SAKMNLEGLVYSSFPPSMVMTCAVVPMLFAEKNFVRPPMRRKPEAKVYKQRFLVEGKDQLLVIGEAEIAYFMTAHEIVYLVRTDGKRWAVEYTLDQLAEMLDPLRFFRLNRQFIGHIGAIARIHPFFNGKLKLQLTPDPGEEVVVSREKAPGFRLWLEGEG